VTCMKMAVFWYVASCSLIDTDRRFREAYYLRHQYHPGGESRKIVWNVRSYATSQRRVTSIHALGTRVFTHRPTLFLILATLLSADAPRVLNRTSVSETTHVDIQYGRLGHWLCVVIYGTLTCLHAVSVAATLFIFQTANKCQNHKIYYWKIPSTERRILFHNIKSRKKKI